MDAGRFRILLAEDDPVSRDFLDAALRACGATVTSCADGHTALTLVRSGAWDMLLLDHHLPGLSGADILVALDADPGGRISRPVAIATTAAPAESGQVLRRAGFVEVLPKPISIEALRAALRRCGWTPETVLDNEAAARSCGSPEAVMRLRRLLVERELPAVLTAIDRCNGDFDSLLSILHRLRAACGFCGTTRLAAAGKVLERELGERDHEAIANALGTFRSAVLETRAVVLRDLSDAAG